jgi:hypothetical protein
LGFSLEPEVHRRVAAVLAFMGSPDVQAKS